MIDTHLHLDDQVFDGKVDQIIAEMKACGVEFVINNSYDLNSMRSSVGLAHKYKEVYATVGMHPHDSKGFDDGFVAEMTALQSDPKVVAVGEIGLDYYYDLSDRQTQRDVFAAQIELADKYGLPVTLHIRDAYGDAQDILYAQRAYLNHGVLWHCYSGSEEFARQMVKKGHYFAFGGAITFKNAHKDDVIRAIPLDRVMTETDSPYMAPVPFRGRTNTPCNIPIVLAKLAQVYDLPQATLEQQIHDNVTRFFTKITL